MAKSNVKKNTTIINKDTFNIVNRPLNKEVLNGHWVYKNKPINNDYINSSRIINKEKTSRYKAYWVI